MSLNGILASDDVVVVAAKRTAIGRFGGALSRLDSTRLATLLCQGVVRSCGVDPRVVDQVILGNVIAAGEGQNVARQVQLNAGFDMAGTAMSVNQVCGSGLKAVRLAQSALLMGDASVVVAGGVESMSNAPALARRTGKKSFDTTALDDSLFEDGLNDAFHGYPVGHTAENLAVRFHLNRAQIDEYALSSQQRAAQASESGCFDEEIIPVAGLHRDEAIRPDTTLEALESLKPVYDSDGTVTAGNASPISDGASVLILTTAARARELGMDVLARITGYAESGYKPELMGYTPVLAVRRLLARSGQDIDDIDLFEVNEAFASQALVVRRELGIKPECYNVSGGAIALGHPLGASGARILTTLIHGLWRLGLRRGIAALCVGGGQAIAMEVECV